MGSCGTRSTLRGRRPLRKRTLPRSWRSTGWRRGPRRRGRGRSGRQRSARGRRLRGRTPRSSPGCRRSGPRAPESGHRRARRWAAGERRPRGLEMRTRRWRTRRPAFGPPTCWLPRRRSRAVRMRVRMRVRRRRSRTSSRQARGRRPRSSRRATQSEYVDTMSLFVLSLLFGYISEKNSSQGFVPAARAASRELEEPKKGGCQDAEGPFNCLQGAAAEEAGAQDVRQEGWRHRADVSEGVH
mmetsp:Transcript_7496/g.27168  ORF Transcript_7496/g.27168 Transcript_7496/m.27168 type:complete len:241 (-) Transcript_7496:1900-2622(-)